MLGIKDLRTDKRIDFVGGIRGLGELQRRVDSGEMKVAFRALSGFDETVDRYRRLGPDHASEDHLVRAETTLGAGHSLARLTWRKVLKRIAL